MSERKKYPDAGSLTVVEMAGNETDAQCREIAWQMFCNAHPIEAYQHNPDGFWRYLHARSPDLTREQMVALLQECEDYWETHPAEADAGNQNER